MVRAALMGGLSLFARTVGRRQDGLNSLGLVAAVMALSNPLILWDAGFQLSFTATLGLILYADPLSEAFTRIASRRLPPETALRLAGPAGEYFLYTLAAQLLSLPVTMYHFKSFSLVAWIANPVVLPVQPPVMVLGGLAVVAGMLFLPLGSLAVVVWRLAFSAPDGRLHLVFMDVGTGDGVLIRTPAGRNLLVDGGPSPSQLSDALGRRLPLANRKLDYLVVAAGNEEQVGALPRVLERFPVQSVLWAGPVQGTYAARQLLEALNGAGIPVTGAQTGHTLDLGQGALLKVLCSGKRGGVLLLEWGSFRLLLPDGGYAPSNPPEGIAALNPHMNVTSAG